MTGYAARHAAALNGHPLPPGGATLADQVLARRQPLEKTPMLTLTIQAASFAELSGMLASAAGTPIVNAARRDTIAVLENHNASVAATVGAGLIDKTDAHDAVKDGAKGATLAGETSKLSEAEKARITAETNAKIDAEIARAKAAEDARNPAAVTETSVTYPDVQQAVFRLHQEKGRDVLVATLAGLSVIDEDGKVVPCKKAQELDAADWPKALAVLEAALAA